MRSTQLSYISNHNCPLDTDTGINIGNKNLCSYYRHQLYTLLKITVTLYNQRNPLTGEVKVGLKYPVVYIEEDKEKIYTLEIVRIAS